jgi:hypothetical protein
LTKHEIKSLEERVHRLDGKPEESTAHYEAEARMSWLIHHLTDEEHMQLARLIRKLESNQLDKAAQDEARELQRKAEERAAANLQALGKHSGRNMFESKLSDILPDD